MMNGGHMGSFGNGGFNGYNGMQQGFNSFDMMARCLSDDCACLWAYCLSAISHS